MNAAHFALYFFAFIGFCAVIVVSAAVFTLWEIARLGRKVVPERKHLQGRNGAVEALLVADSASRRGGAA